MKSPIGETNVRVVSTNQVRQNQPNDELIDNVVSNFVDSVRIQHRREELQELERRKSSEGGSAEGGAYERAKTRTDKNVLEAEKFKATVAQPGNYDLIAPLQSQNTNELGGGKIGEMDVDFNTRGPQMTEQLLIPNIG